MSDATQQELGEQGASAAQGTIKPDIIDQLLKPEVQESLTTLVEQLPKLTEMMTQLTRMYDLVQKVSADSILIKDMTEGIQEIALPIKEKIKGVASAVIEANGRAEHSDKHINIFGMLNLLKEPELQRMLRFVQAYLEIVEERKTNLIK